MPKPFQTPPNILKEGEGDNMKMNRKGGGVGESLVELGEKRMRIADSQFN